MSVRRADDTRYVLGEALTATGDPVAIGGGQYMFFVEGTAGSATSVRLEIQSPNGTWSRIAFPGNNIFSILVAEMPLAKTAVDLPAGDVRLAIIGGAATSINGYLVGLG